jgi:hypothetical protein
MLEAHDVMDDAERTLGLWGGPEPSFNVLVTGARDDVFALAAEWGKTYNQEAVAVLTPNAKARGGVMSWDYGQPLNNAQMDVLLDGLNAVSHEFGEFVGLSVRDNQRVEYWFGDEAQRAKAQMLIDEAMRRASLPAVYQSPQLGFGYALLKRGEDY